MHLFLKKKIEINRVVDFVNHNYIVVLKDKSGLYKYDFTGRT